MSRTAEQIILEIERSHMARTAEQILREVLSEQVFKIAMLMAELEKVTEEHVSLTTLYTQLKTEVEKLKEISELEKMNKTDRVR